MCVVTDILHRLVSTTMNLSWASYFSPPLTVGNLTAVNHPLTPAQSAPSLKPGKPKFLRLDSTGQETSSLDGIGEAKTSCSYTRSRSMPLLSHLSSIANLSQTPGSTNLCPPSRLSDSAMGILNKPTSYPYTHVSVALSDNNNDYAHIPGTTSAFSCQMKSVMNAIYSDNQHTINFSTCLDKRGFSDSDFISTSIQPVVNTNQVSSVKETEPLKEEINLYPVIPMTSSSSEDIVDSHQSMSQAGVSSDTQALKAPGSEPTMVHSGTWSSVTTVCPISVTSTSHLDPGEVKATNSVHEVAAWTSGSEDGTIHPVNDIVFSTVNNDSDSYDDSIESPLDESACFENDIIDDMKDLSSIDSGIDVKFQDEKKTNVNTVLVSMSEESIPHHSTSTCHIDSIVPFPKKKKPRPSSKKRKRKKKQCSEMPLSVNVRKPSLDRSNRANRYQYNVSVNNLSTNCDKLDKNDTCSISIQFKQRTAVPEKVVEGSPFSVCASVLFSLSPSGSEDEVEWSDMEDYLPSDDCFDLLNSFTDPLDSLVLVSGILDTATPCPIIKSFSSPELCRTSTMSRVNDQWEQVYGTPMQDGKNSKKPKVCFSDAPPVVHQMVTWNYAYRAARKTHWELFALDRCRFKTRVAEVEKSIGHVFEERHRNKVYKKYYS